MADEEKLNGEPAVGETVDPVVELSTVEKARAARPVRKTEPKGVATPKRDDVIKARTKEIEEAKRTTPVAFVKQAVAEVGKVVWPTGDQLSQSFVVVLTFVLFIMTIVVLLDTAFGWLLIKLLG